MVGDVLPSHDTLSDVFARLNPSELERGFERWVSSLAAAVRDQGSIENQLHWSLDVTFAEECNQTRLGYAPENLALFRRLALLLLRREISL